MEELSKKSKSVKPSKFLLIENTVKKDNLKDVKLDMLKYQPTYVNKKVNYYFTNVCWCLSKIFYYANMI